VQIAASRVKLIKEALFLQEIVSTLTRPSLTTKTQVDS